jgi:hypothetical protein
MGGRLTNKSLEIFDETKKGIIIEYKDGKVIIKDKEFKL